MWARHRVLAVMAPIIVTAAALRLFHLDYHDLRGDEAFSIFFAQSDWSTMIRSLRTVEPNPPLYYFALRAWMSLVGQSEFATRWLSAAAGVALVPLVYAFWRRLGDPRAGVFAAVLVAANPDQIWHSQDARMYTMATAFSVGVLYFGLRIAGVGRPVRRHDGIGLAATSLLALFSHYVAAVLVAVVNGVVALHWFLKRKPAGPAARIWALSAGVTALVFLPWLVMIALPGLGPSYGGNIYSPTPAEAVWNVLTTFAAGQLASAQIAPLLALATIATAGLGAMALAWRQPLVAAVLIASLCIPFLALFVASATLVASWTRPVFSPIHLVLVSPAFYLLIAKGLALLPSPPRIALRPRMIVVGTTMALATAIVVLTTMALQSYYVNRGGEGRGGWRPYVGYVVHSASPADLVVVNHLDPAFFYYYQRLGGRAQTTVQPPRLDATAEDLDQGLAPLLSPGRTVWLVPDGMHTYDKKGIVAAWLDRHAVRGASTRVAGIELVKYRIPGGEPLAIAFGGLAELERYEVLTASCDQIRLASGRDPHPNPLPERARGLARSPDASANRCIGQTTLAPGAGVTIDLVWRAIAPIERDYTISVQLLDDRGRLVAQSDGPPTNGRAPTSTWRTSGHVVDERIIKLPNKPGIYRVGVAMYELTSLQRLLVPGTSDNLAPLGTVEVR